jgi:hypothetical protein
MNTEIISNQATTADAPFAAFVALDWADQKHAWALQAADSTRIASPNWIARLPSCLRLTQTSRSSTRCPALAQCWRPACWPPWDPGVSATRAPRRFSATAALLPWSNAAARPVRFISAGPVRSFSGKRFTNGPCTRSVRRNGRAPTISSSARKESRITPPSARWPSSGFASCTAVGRTAPPITNRRTRSHCAGGSLRSRLGQLTPWQPRALPSRGKPVQASRNWCSQPLDWSTSDDCSRVTLPSLVKL